MLVGNNDLTVSELMVWVSQYLAKVEDVLETFADIAPKEGTTASIEYYRHVSFTLEMTKALVGIVETWSPPLSRA